MACTQDLFAYVLMKKSSEFKQKAGVQISGTTGQLLVVSYNTHFDFSRVNS